MGGLVWNMIENVRVPLLKYLGAQRLLSLWCQRGKMRIKVSVKGLLVPADVYTRGGSHSPFAIYPIIDGKRITPYECRRLGIAPHMTLNGLFQITYGPLIARMMPVTNWLMRNVLKYE